MKTRKLAVLSLAALILSAVCYAGMCYAGIRSDPRFAHREHLSTLQLYRLGHTSSAIRDNIGRFVTLDVVVTREVAAGRATPLVEIVMPPEFKKGLGTVQNPIQAHLEGSNSDLDLLRSGDRARVEGIIVNEGYGAYFIYVLSVYDRVRPKALLP
jgi:hypothetical protein